MRVLDVERASGARLVRGDAARALSGVSTDTRTLRPGELFLALRGHNFDGNRFAARAAEGGAGALLLRGERHAPPEEAAGLPPALPLLVHPDPVAALGELAAWHRGRLGARVVGITGSCGKTTTKRILARLLSARMPTVESPSSFNNHVGVPHTLLLAGERTRALVVEMGTNSPGEIAGLCRVARPEAGVITNVGASHLEGLGSIEGVAREKAALFASLPASGFAVLNLDSRHAPLLREAARCRVITCSVEGRGGERGELDATQPHFHAGGTSFRLEGRLVRTPLLGIHNVSNVLLALAACRGLGIEPAELEGELARLECGPRRMERREIGGVTVLDDCYNANPDSALAAVRVLAGLEARGRRVLVLGDMLELGEQGPALHRALGAEVARCGLERLVLVGRLAGAAADGAVEAGMDPGRIVGFATADDAAGALGELVEPGDVVLFKASRGMALERLIERLDAARGAGVS